MGGDQLAVEFFALGIESDAVNVCGVGAGEGHVETAGAAAIERCVAEQHAALAGGALECEFEDYVFVAFVEDEPAAGAGLGGSGDGAVFDAPCRGAEGVPSGEARAVERMDGGGWRVGAQRGEGRRNGYGGGQNQGRGRSDMGALTFGGAWADFYYAGKWRARTASQESCSRPKMALASTDATWLVIGNSRNRPSPPPVPRSRMRGPHARLIRSSGSLSGNIRKLS